MSSAKYLVVYYETGYYNGEHIGCPSPDFENYEDALAWMKWRKNNTPNNYPTNHRILPWKAMRYPTSTVIPPGWTLEGRIARPPRTYNEYGEIAP